MFVCVWRTEQLVFPSARVPCRVFSPQGEGGPQWARCSPAVMGKKERELVGKKVSERQIEACSGHSVLQSIWGYQLYHCWRWACFSSPSFCFWSSQALSSVFLPQAGHLCAQQPVQVELIQRCQQLQSRLSTLKIENEEVMYTWSSKKNVHNKCVHIHSLFILHLSNFKLFCALFVSKHWLSKNIFDSAVVFTHTFLIPRISIQLIYLHLYIWQTLLSKSNPWQVFWLIWSNVKLPIRV